MSTLAIRSDLPNAASQARARAAAPIASLGTLLLISP